MFFIRPSHVSLCSSRRRKRQLDASLAKLLLYTYVIHTCSPKGKQRKDLKSAGCIKKLEFTRTMSNNASEKCHEKRFSLESFTYLMVDANILTLDPIQDKDGDMLITFAVSKKGCRPFSCKLVDHLTCAKFNHPSFHTGQVWK